MSFDIPVEGRALELPFRRMSQSPPCTPGWTPLGALWSGSAPSGLPAPCLEPTPGQVQMQEPSGPGCAAGQMEMQTPAPAHRPDLTGLSAAPGRPDSSVRHSACGPDGGETSAQRLCPRLDSPASSPPRVLCVVSLVDGSSPGCCKRVLRAAVAESHGRGSLNNTHSFSHQPGGWSPRSRCGQVGSSRGLPGV